MCTFAVEKVVVALANSYQRTEKEQLTFWKGYNGLFLLYVYMGIESKMTLREFKHFIY